MKNNKILILLTFAGLIAMQQIQAGWDDVTDKVRSFGSQQFSVTNGTFGHDPAYMIRKTLQIIKTNPATGQNIKMEEFNEGDNAQINVDFTSARYGADTPGCCNNKHDGEGCGSSNDCRGVCDFNGICKKEARYCPGCP